MMKNQKEIAKLQECVKNKAMCALNRDYIDVNTMYGFLVELSGELAVLSFVYDFILDGYKIIRTCDVTDVMYTESERFFEEIVLKENGEAKPQPTGFAIETMYMLCKDLMRRGVYVTVECEGFEENVLYIGKIEKVTEKELSLRIFDAMGIWEKEPVCVPLEDVTCISVGNHYVNVLSKYLSE